MLRITAALFILMLIGPMPGAMRPPGPFDDRRIVIVQPVAGVEPGLRVGPLTLSGAWQLTSPNPKFGGLSGLALTGPHQFRAVADSGFWLDFRLADDNGIGDLRWVDIVSQRLPRMSKLFLDAEAVTSDPDSGRSWIALERVAQIWRFNRRGERTGKVRNPIIQRWPQNAGPESLARIADRRFIAVSERRIGAVYHEGVMFSGDPVAAETRHFGFRYDSRNLGSVVDIAALADGRALVLHRKLGFSPVFTSSLAIIDPRGLRPGGVITAQPLAVLRHPQLAENYEGLAIEEDGRDLAIWLLSDDNQNDWQATRLLRFALDPGVLSTSAPANQGAAKRAQPLPVRP